MSKDSIGLRGGDTNLYRYVYNNPLIFTDPNGTFVVTLGGATAAGAILGGLAGAYGAYVAGGDFNSIASGAVGGAVGGAAAVILGAGAAITSAGGAVALGAALESTSVIGVLAGEAIGLGISTLLNFTDLGLNSNSSSQGTEGGSGPNMCK